MKSVSLVVSAALLVSLAQSAFADDARAGRGSLLTITTYGTGNEGHLITFPDSTTLAIDCATGTIAATSHFHADHCASCDDRGQYNRTNLVPGQYLYDGDGVTVQVVAANGRVIGQEPAQEECPASDENKMSVGLLVSYGGFDYLTCGDLTTAVENPLGSALAGMGVNVDVLKVSHHGSRSSSSLTYLQTVLPEYAVVAGNASAPYEETLDNLTDAGVKTIYYARDYPRGDGYPVFRANGDIALSTDGSTFTFSGGGFSHGPYAVDDAVAPTPTPAPVPPPPPGQYVQVAASPSAASAGDRLEVSVSLQPILGRPFDAYAVILGPPGVFSIRFGNSLAPGVSPLARGVFHLPGGYNATLLDMTVPPGVPGEYQAIVGLADAGAAVTGVESAFAWGVAYFSVR